MRGGTANCTVVVSDEPIASPITNTPNELIIMNIPSLIKFEKEIQSDGLMVINTSVVDRDTIRDDISIIKVDANAIAEKLGNLKVANMVVLGAYLKKTGAVTLEGVKALEEKLTGSKAALVNLNIRAIEEG